MKSKNEAHSRNRSTRRIQGTLLALPLALGGIGLGHAALASTAPPALQHGGPWALADGALEDAGAASQADGRRESGTADDLGRRPVPLRQRPADGSFDARDWEQRLRDADMDRRLSAFDALAQEARRNPAARAQLEAWSADPDAGELAWTARLLLRELAAGAWPGGFGRGWRGGPGNLLEDLFGESRGPGGPGGIFGPPSGGPGSGGPSSGGPGSGGPGSGGPGSGGHLFRDLHTHFGDALSALEQRLRELERNLGPWLGPQGAPPPPPLPPPPGGALGSSSTGRSVSVEVGPAGAHVRISEIVDGEERVEEYRADSLEELLDRHPELRASIGSLSLRGLPAPPSGGRGAAVEPRPLLGVHFTPLSPERALELGLDEGAGLVVEAVVPGSLAERLGLRAGDILLELAGQPLRGAEDVRRALAGHPPGAALEARLIDAGGTPRAARVPYTPPRRAQEGIETRRL